MTIRWLPSHIWHRIVSTWKKSAGSYIVFYHEVCSWSWLIRSWKISLNFPTIHCRRLSFLLPRSFIHHRVFWEFRMTQEGVEKQRKRSWLSVARQNHVCSSWNSRRTQRFDSRCFVRLPRKKNGYLFQWSKC